MSDAPDRIAIKWQPGAAITSGPLMEHKDYTRFVREDVAQAMVAAAYEAAADDIMEYAIIYEDVHVEGAQERVRNLTPTDARAALDAMLAKAREEREMFAWAMEAVAKAREDALREAAEVVNRNLGKPAHHAHGAILALIDAPLPKRGETND